jgi:dihydrofolate reductase/thymidylate synthase
MNIIVAFNTKNFGIGTNGKIPWNIPEDLKYFKELTENNIVVMGRKTYDSIPEKNKPLKNRLNIIVTSNPTKYTSNENVIFVLMEELDTILDQFKDKKIYIIGGNTLYQKYLGKAEKIYSTQIDKEFICDTYFPLKGFEYYEIESYSKLYYAESEKCNYKYITYTKSNKIHDEHYYINNLDNIIWGGNKRPDRTGTGTISKFGGQVCFDISKSFPLITTKFVGYKSIIKELLFFLQGKTNSNILKNQGVSIWEPNTTREFLDNRGLSDYQVGDLGPMYGFNWRHWNTEYKGCDADYTGKGYDQLNELIQGLKNDPYSRRHLLTTYNPDAVEKSVLCPCHGISIQFYVEDKNDKKYLSCHMYQRSVDNFLGFPYNIASYSALTYIIAKITDMLPDKLYISMGDSHIYLNHIEQVKLQISRNILPFPILELSDSIKTKNINEITIDDFNLVGYLHHSAIKATMAV